MRETREGLYNNSIKDKKPGPSSTTNDRSGFLFRTYLSHYPSFLMIYLPILFIKRRIYE